MQTLQFTKAVARIASSLRAEELIRIVQPLLSVGSAQQITDQLRDQFSASVMASRVGYARLSDDPATKTIMDYLGLSGVYAPERLGRLIRHLGATPTVTQLTSSPAIYTDFFSFFDQLTWLVNLRDTTGKLLQAGKLGGTPPEDVLEVRILDYDNAGVEAERAQVFFTGIVEIHLQLSLLLKLPESRLRILYVDSGSDFIVALQCAKAILDIVRGLLAEFWEKFRDLDLNNFNKRIDAMTKGLSFIGLVKQQVDGGIITAEDGKNLSHRVIQEVTKLAFSGVSLPHDEIVITIDQRKLLEQARDIKLLGQGNAKAEGDAKDGDGDGAGGGEE